MSGFIESIILYYKSLRLKKIARKSSRLGPGMIISTAATLLGLHDRFDVNNQFSIPNSS